MNTKAFIQYAEAFFRRRYEGREIAWRTWYNSISRLRCFESYCRQFPSKKIDTHLIQQYKLWCLSRGDMPGTVNQKLLPLIQSLKEASEKGLVPVSSLKKMHSLYCNLHPRRYGEQAQQLSGNAGVVNTVRYLTDAQLRRLFRYYRHLSDGKEKDVLDLFFFAFHACGLRVSDIITLEWRHIHFRNNVLTKVLVKTKTAISIPLSDPALEILSRWKQSPKRNQRFVFGLLPDDFDLADDVALAGAIDRRNRSIRAVLGRIGPKVKIPFPLGMHVARHSFAVKALNAKGVSVHMISRLLGHSSVLVTEKVYATFLMPTLSRGVRTCLSFPEFGL